MKKALTRSLAVLIIIGLSLGIGFIYTSTYDKLEHRSYPLGFKNLVEKYSEKYGVPEIIIYSMIKVESDFQSTGLTGNDSPCRSRQGNTVKKFFRGDLIHHQTARGGTGTDEPDRFALKHFL